MAVETLVLRDLAATTSDSTILSNSNFVGTDIVPGTEFHSDHLTSIRGTIRIDGRDQGFAGLVVNDGQRELVLASRHFVAADARPHLGKKVKITVVSSAKVTRNGREQVVHTTKIEAA